MNLLRLEDLDIKEINELLTAAQKLKDQKIHLDYSNKIVANMFFEPSTRTQNSFHVAEHKLGCKVINFNTSTSSMNKGETFYDTVKTIDSLSVDAIVIRSAQDKWYQTLIKHTNASLINAGDGMCDHPSQTLLDLLTVKQEFRKFEGLTVLIVGDILHSRVAHSNIKAFKRLGMHVLIAAPKEFQDRQYDYVDFEKALQKADIVNMLRIQNERLTDKMSMTTKTYNQQYGLNRKRLKLMKKQAIIIHPAPVNRNVEMDDAIVECAQSRIFKQIENGVYVRMAILDWVFKK